MNFPSADFVAQSKKLKPVTSARGAKKMGQFLDLSYFSSDLIDQLSKCDQNNMNSNVGLF